MYKFIVFSGQILFGLVGYHFQLIPKTVNRFQKVAGGGKIIVDDDDKVISFEGNSIDYGYPDKEAVIAIFEKDREDIINSLEMLNEMHGKSDNLKDYKVYIYIKEV